MGLVIFVVVIHYLFIITVIFSFHSFIYSSLYIVKNFFKERALHYERVLLTLWILKHLIYISCNFYFNIHCDWFLKFGNWQTHEKKPRESILRAEFANAIEFINKDLSEESRLRFLHWDLHKHSRRYTCAQFYPPTPPPPLFLSNNSIFSWEFDFYCKIVSYSSPAIPAKLQMFCYFLAKWLRMHLRLLGSSIAK